MPDLDGNIAEADTPNLESAVDAGHYGLFLTRHRREGARQWVAGEGICHDPDERSLFSERRAEDP